MKDLIRVLEIQKGLQDELGTVIERKIDAMRSADIHRMRELGDRERVLLQAVHEREGLRYQLMDTIGKELGLSSRIGRGLCVSQLIDRLSKTDADELRRAAEELRVAVGRVARLNRVAGLISGDILRHLRWVFASIKPANGRPEGYSGAGVVVDPVHERIIEVVG